MENNVDLDYCVIELKRLKRDLGKNIYDIGVYLNHIKDNKLYLYKYKFWLEFLEKETEFSERSASRFMKIVKEFDEPTLAELGSSKADILVSLEKEEREELILEGGLEDKSVREVAEIVKEVKEEKTPLKEQEAVIDGVPKDERDYFLEFEDCLRNALAWVSKAEYHHDGLEYRKHFNEYARKHLLIQIFNKIQFKITEGFKKL